MGFRVFRFLHHFHSLPWLQNDAKIPKRENAKMRKPDFFATNIMIQWKNNAETWKHVLCVMSLRDSSTVKTVCPFWSHFVFLLHFFQNTVSVWNILTSMDFRHYITVRFPNSKVFRHMFFSKYVLNQNYFLGFWTLLFRLQTSSDIRYLLYL